MSTDLEKTLVDEDGEITTTTESINDNNIMVSDGFIKLTPEQIKEIEKHEK